MRNYLKKLLLNLFDDEYAINEPKAIPREKNTCEAAACHVLTHGFIIIFFVLATVQ